ncbi:MAG TPA: hypothetical protein VMZ03_01520 [Chitinophagaceae bacterium]|nr:hypothetical protein [Chitinophagaceae bacterium]
MRTLYALLFLGAIACSVVSCGGKSKSDAAAKYTLTAGTDNQGNRVEDSTLAPVKTFLEQDLAQWMASFTGIHIDSFRNIQKSDFENTEYDQTTDLTKFYELYKASCNFSPDSSQFIDLYSAGLMLEKKGKKIIASADVDQAVTLCDLKNKEWKRIASFGPSAGIEEAIWISPSTFILAGVMYNDNGQPTPLLMIGDINKRSFRWFEANSVRPPSSKYEPSGLKKLKIDEWE